MHQFGGFAGLGDIGDPRFEIAVRHGLADGGGFF